MADQYPELHHASLNSDHRLSDLFQILEITRNLAITNDLQSLLEQIEDAATNIFQCERATVFVYDNNTDELFSFVPHRKESIRIASNEGIAGACFKTGKACKVENAYSDKRFNPKIDQLTGFKTNNILAYPMHGYDQRPLGVLEVLNKASDSFDDWDEILIKTLAAQCGIAIHRQFLTDQALEKLRIQRDLDLARKIQISLLPRSAPEIQGFDIFGWSQTADETGGDFFDFQKLTNGRLLASIADVAGHGIGSAILAAECSAFQRSAFSLEPDIPKSLTHINKLLSENIPDNYFITAFVCSLNPNTSDLDFISAGHGPVLLYRDQNNRVENLPIHDMPLGIFSDTCYHQLESLRLNSGDILIACTDGFYEWENPQGISFGIDRIAETLIDNKDLCAKKIISSIYVHLLKHCEHTTQPDDLTAIIIKKL